MLPNEYQQLALRTEVTPSFVSEAYMEARQREATNGGLEPAQLKRLLHALLGLCTETGEIQDMVKKALIYGRPFDLPNVLEEIGDLCWYAAVALDACGYTFDQAMKKNIHKLQVRFPVKFTEDAANNRNLEAERKVLTE